MTDDPTHPDDTHALSGFSRLWRWTAILLLIALPFILLGIIVLL